MMERGRGAGPFGPLVLALALVSTSAYALDVHVKDAAGNPVSGFRWLLQEDNTYHPTVGERNTATLSLNFHASHAPVLASGHEASATAAVTIPALYVGKYCFVSVLPDANHSMGAAPVAPGQTSVDVLVHQHPIPTGQISVFVFEDNAPTNNAPDLPQEQGLAGFKILLEDGGGKYGAAAGRMAYDAFGYPLGTVYDENGDVAAIGDGVITTDADGRALIRNLAPGKYGIIVVPPVVANGPPWQQVTTIEGTPVIDAWPKPNEPPVFVEFGPPGFHVFMGFTKKYRDPALAGGGSIQGQIVNLHNSRPPDFTFYTGKPVEGAWVALNEVTPIGPGRQLFASAVADLNPTPGAPDDGTFFIPNLPAGTKLNPKVYQLAIWDRNLVYIVSMRNISIPDPRDPTLATAVNLGQVPVFHWYAHYDAVVFNDLDGDGFRDPGEPGILDQVCNLRFRDGTIYKFMPTDIFGDAPFETVFPFFFWLVAEIDFTNYKATGATIAVDNGGFIDPAADRTPLNPTEDPFGQWVYPDFGGSLSPQEQFKTDPTTGAVILDPTTNLPAIPDVNPHTGNNLSRTETGEVLTEAFQVFLGQTIHIEWGKQDYKDGENGGIAGIVYYAVTRAEDDPNLAVAEVWEPGIPRVEVALYEDKNGDGVIDDKVPGAGNVPAGSPYADPANPNLTMPDIDNYPLSADPATGAWGTAGPGAEDIDWNGNGRFDLGDAADVTWTDSFDDSLPTGMQGNVEPFMAFGTHRTDTFDGLRNFNQVRPGVFDGGYIFNGPLPEGAYIVEVMAPPGYELLREESKNVDFGDVFCAQDIPGQACPTPFPPPQVQAKIDGMVGPANPPIPGGPMDLRPIIPAGRLHTVAAELSLFPGVPAPFAGETRPGVERKLVHVENRANTACDFFLYTEVPIAGRIVGFVLNDLANEFDPNSPTFGEKQTPSFLPISLRDWTGAEISRSGTDRWGSYNFLVPSTYSTNLPQPSGVSPNMLTVSINDPGPIPNPAFGLPGEPAMITDPRFNPKYSQFSYTFQYMPGSTTYLDTPVVPVGAFATPGQLPPDCEPLPGTPVIQEVTCVSSGGGPYVKTAGETLTITSPGPMTDVPNPRYDPNCVDDPATPFDECAFAANPFVPRDLGFGVDTGTGRVTIGGKLLTVLTWTPQTITATVPAGVTTGQLTVVRGDNDRASEVGVTVTVGALPRPPLRVSPPGVTVPAAGSFATIQEAVDAAVPGDLILVPPGRFEELVIVYKPVQLQGWGALSTVINAVQSPADKIIGWRNKMELLFNTGKFDLLPAQQAQFRNFRRLEPAIAAIEGAGISVFASNSFDALKFGIERPARIDGLAVKGSSNGGGILINGYVDNLEICNNRIITNHGNGGGGVRVGHPDLAPDGQFQDNHNDYIRVHHNLIAGNGSIQGGGGVSLNKGSDFYEVSDNRICANFTSGNGGGIGHLGFSEGGRILRNKLLFNQSFNQGLNRAGGGISIAGQAPVVAALGVVPVAPGAAVPVTRAELTQGTGSVDIVGNRLQGNQAGAGNGGGISLALINGQDIFDSPADASAWHTIQIRRNIIVDNQAGQAGGGMSLADAVSVIVRNNTIANNESTATVGDAFPPRIDPNVPILTSEPEVGGIVSHQHTTKLEQFITNQVPATVKPARLRSRYSDPLLVNDIIFQNRSFFFDAVVVSPPGVIPPLFSYQLVLDGNWDMGVKGGVAGAKLHPIWCLLTDIFRTHKSNFTAPLDPVTGLPDAGFIYPYQNVDRGQTVKQVEFTTIPKTAIAFDEGGNFIDVRFGPLTETDENGVAFDYHLKPTSVAIDAGNSTNFLVADVDGQRTAGVAADVGADEAFPIAGNSTSPVGVNDEYTGVRGVFLTRNVLENDFDPDGDSVYAQGLAYSFPDPATVGTVTIWRNGTLRFTPVAGYLGRFTVLYRTWDRIGRGSAPDSKFSTAAVTIEVIEAPLTGNQPPAPVLANAKPLPGGGNGVLVLPHSAPCPTSAADCGACPATGPQPTVGSVRVNPNDPDPQDTHTFALMSANPENPALPAGPLNGCVTVDAATGGALYTPFSGYNGPDYFYILVTENPRPAFPGMTPLSGWVRVPVEVTRVLPPSQDILVQMPLDTDGKDTDGDGKTKNDNVYILLGAGDGFSKMADGRIMYGFGFNDLSRFIQGPGSVAMPVFPDPADPTKTDPAADPYGLHAVPLRTIMDIGVGTLGAKFPASTIKVKQGQKVFLNLTNVGMALRPDLFDGHTLHWHGFPNASAVFDGVPDSSIAVNMMANLTYFYNVAEAGTYMYHCHVEAAEHMEMGMLGNLYVTPYQDEDARRLRRRNPAQNPAVTPGADPSAIFGGGLNFAYNDGDGSTGYDVDLPLQIGSFDPDFHDADAFVQPLPFAAMRDRYPLLNGRGYPDTLKPDDAATLPVGDPGADPDLVSQDLGSLVNATVGQRILLRISDLNVTRFYTLASTLPMQVVGRDARLLRNSRFVTGGASVTGTNATLDGITGTKGGAGLSTTVNAYKNRTLTFLTGQLRRLSRKIVAYDGAGGFTFDAPLPEAPANGDRFKITSDRDLYYTTTSLDIGGGVSFDAIIDTAGVAPGDYPIYTTNLNYLHNNEQLDDGGMGGMVTEIHVR